MKTVFRVQPIERGGICGICNHNSRAVDAEHIDPERTHLNFYLRGDSEIETALRANIDGVPMARGCKDKSKENVAAEMIMSASPEFFENGGDVRAWAEKSLAWIDEKFPGRCISCVAHLDEVTPHLHAILRVDVEKARVHPVSKEKMAAKKVLSYSDFFVDRKEILNKARLLGRSHLDTKLGRLQTSYADAVSGFGLQRGECSARSQRNVQHLTPAEFRAREKALVEQTAILEQTKKMRADLAAVQKSVMASRAEKTGLEKEAGALRQKNEERQKEEGKWGAALVAKKTELVAMEKEVSEKAALVAKYENSAESITAKARAEFAEIQQRIGVLKNEGAMLEAAAMEGQKKVASLQGEIAALEKLVAQIEGKKSELLKLEKVIKEKGEWVDELQHMRDHMEESQKKTQMEIYKMGAELEKMKDQVAGKTEVPTWTLLCQQAGDPNKAAQFIKGLPEALGRAVAKTAQGETQEKLMKLIRETHAPVRKHDRGMSMGM